MPELDCGNTAPWGIILQELLHPVSLVTILVAVADQGSWRKKKILEAKTMIQKVICGLMI